MTTCVRSVNMSLKSWFSRKKEKDPAPLAGAFIPERSPLDQELDLDYMAKGSMPDPTKTRESSRIDAYTRSEALRRRLEVVGGCVQIPLPEEKWGLIYKKGNNYVVTTKRGEHITTDILTALAILGDMFVEDINEAIDE